MKIAFRALFSFLVLALSISASASMSDADNTLVVRPRTSVEEGSSEHMRVGKQFLITAETGLSVGSIPAGGIDAAYFLNRNNLIQVDTTGGSLDILGAVLRTRTAAVGFKHFYGNSFYSRTGIGYREIDLGYTGYYRTVPEENLGNVKSVVLDAAIGNQWQWENFTLGCDWFGIMAPISTISSHVDLSRVSYQDQDDARSNWEKIEKVTSPQLLRFYLGASF